MTATNHAITGAVVALAIKRPELAIPLAFLSHFAIDMIPHYEAKGVVSGLNSGIKKIKQKSFQLFLAGDFLLTLALMIALPLTLNNHVYWWIILACMVAGVIPDSTWGWHLYRAKVNKKITNPNWLTRFHIWIQWCEKPWGIYVEIVWLALMAGIIFQLAD